MNGIIEPLGPEHRKEALAASPSRRGFRECGRRTRVGRKWGEDFDLVRMQMDL